MKLTVSMLCCDSRDSWLPNIHVVHNWIVILFRFIYLSHGNSEMAVLDIKLIAAMRVEKPAFNPLIALTARRGGNSGLVFRGKKER
jgi:hypothetical protein